MKTENNEFDFDLPEVEMTPSTKPRVHISSEVCESCQG
jgi:hypothetical protein